MADVNDTGGGFAPPPFKPDTALEQRKFSDETPKRLARWAQDES